MKKLLALVLVLALALSVAASAAGETVLRMAVGYNSAKTGFSFKT